MDFRYREVAFEGLGLTLQRRGELLRSGADSFERLRLSYEGEGTLLNL